MTDRPILFVVPSSQQPLRTSVCRSIGKLVSQLTDRISIPRGFVVKTAGRDTGVRISGVQEAVGKSNCVLCGSLRASRETLTATSIINFESRMKRINLIARIFQVAVMNQGFSITSFAARERRCGGGVQDAEYVQKVTCHPSRAGDALDCGPGHRVI